MGETETTDTTPDPRTAEVLRAVQRARGMVATAGSPVFAPVAERVPERLPSREVHSTGAAALQDVAESLASSLRVLENALANAIEKLTDFQRGQDRAVRELRDAAQGLKHQADVLAGWHAWTGRRVATWGVILALLVAAAVALSWRTQKVALGTHAVLEQILENQVRAQAAKSGKRR